MENPVTVLFHLTRIEHLPSIMQHGLIPGFSRGITCNRKQGTVFLTDDINVPIEQLGSTYSPEGWVVLQVDVEGLQVEPYRTTGLLINQIIPNEFVIKTPIHPERINHDENH
jgi:RNA:NAD 2'-phosphotransferase (TPT1/KptA family)